jgi:LysM repeat protein
MRNSIFFVILIFAATISFSQDLMVKSGTRGLYLEHKAGAKESLYSIARVYHVHPKLLAAYNNLDVTKGLNIGQALNIPLTDTNLNRKSAEGRPVYYQSSQKQTPGSVSALSKTPSANIRDWNKLKDDNIAAGTKIIIGYLAVDGQAAATEAVKPEIAATKQVVEEKQQERAAIPGNQVEAKAEEAVKTAVVKEDAAKTGEQVQHAVQTTTVAEGDGFFKIYFAQQVKAFPLSKDETVTAGIFKTTSGWNDGKYYALIDGIDPGTIIRVINPDNNKTVFAKVLGQISGIRQNQGYNLRISNAAAAALQIAEMDKFIVKVNY